VIVAADTSGLITLFNLDDPAYEQAVAVADGAELLVTTALALTEVHWVVTSRVGAAAADHVLRSLTAHIRTERLAVADTSAELIDTALAVRARYRNLNLDLVDAAIVAVAAEYDTDAVLTLDQRDFRAIRPLGRWSCFRVLPADLG
jgi:predicted nucleic acid-binding protein